MSTVTVLELTQKQPPPEFGRIFEDYYDLVYRTAYSVTRTPQDAEDVVQTIFLRLLRREVPPDLTRHPKAYFYRAAVNVSLKTVRSRDRHVLSGEAEQFEIATALDTGGTECSGHQEDEEM